MMTKVQEYWLPFLDQYQAENIRPAQFVHENDESDYVTGFISEVLSYGYVICLFDPIDINKLPITVDPRNESLDQNQIAARLETALSKNEFMRDPWARIVNGETLEK